MVNDAIAEQVGDWWLPGKPDDRMPGMLRIDQSGAGALQIFGDLAPLDDYHSPVPQRAILGRTSSGPVSVWDCQPSSRQMGDLNSDRAVTPSTIFEVHRTLIGADHFPDPDAPVFAGVSMTLAHLPAWCRGVVDSRDAEAYFSRRAQLKGARITISGGAMPTLREDFFGHQMQYGITIETTLPTSLDELYFRWQRPFINYLEVAVDSEVRVLAERVHLPATTSNGFPKAVDVYVRGARPVDDPPRLSIWQLAMRLKDEKLQTRLRRWWEIDRQASHGLSNLSMLYANNNPWVNNRLMAIAFACESLNRALDRAPARDKEQIAIRKRIAATIADREDRAWFNDRTQTAGQAGFMTRMLDFISPIAGAVYPLIGNGHDWAERVTRARNDLAHANEAYVESQRDIRHDAMLAEVTRLIVVARLMHELGYSSADLRERVILSPQGRSVAQTWWDLTHG